MRVLVLVAILWAAGASSGSAAVQISYQATTRYAIADIFTANMDARDGSLTLVQTGLSITPSSGRITDPHNWATPQAGVLLMGERIDALGNPHLVLGVANAFAPQLIGHAFTDVFSLANEQLVLGSLELIGGNSNYPPALQILLDFTTEIVGDGATFVPDGGGFTLVSFSSGEAIGAGTASIDAPPSASVPEPAGWATMMLGFGLIGHVVRPGRRRPSASAPWDLSMECGDGR